MYGPSVKHHHRVTYSPLVKYDCSHYCPILHIVYTLIADMTGLDLEIVHNLDRLWSGSMAYEDFVRGETSCIKSYRGNHLLVFISWDNAIRTSSPCGSSGIDRPATIIPRRIPTMKMKCRHVIVTHERDTSRPLYFLPLCKTRYASSTRHHSRQIVKSWILLQSDGPGSGSMCVTCQASSSSAPRIREDMSE